MEKVKLSKKITIDGKDTDVLELDFDKVTGNMLIDAEKMMRTAGDMTPNPYFAQTFQSALASKICPLSFIELGKLPGKDFAKICTAVFTFLLGD